MQHVGEDREQVFGRGVILLMKELKCLLATGVNACHAFEKHLDDGIAGGDLGLQEQAADQGLPFGKGDLLEFCNVKDPGLCREVLDLRARDAVEQALHPGERLDPHEVNQHVLQVRERRTLGNGFEPLEFGVMGGNVARRKERVQGHGGFLFEPCRNRQEVVVIDLCMVVPKVKTIFRSN